MRPHGLAQRCKVERSKFTRIGPALAILVAAAAAVPATSAGAAERLATSSGTTVQTAYQNPVSKTFADT